MIEEINQHIRVHNILEEFSKFFDTNKLRENLLLCALYMATFELLKIAIIQNLRSFFSGVQEVDTMKTMPERYRTEMEKYFIVYRGQPD